MRDSSVTSPLDPSGRQLAFESARAAWPAIRLTFSQFSAHLDGLGCRGAPVAHVDSLYLCAACARGVHGACSAFEHRFLPELRRYLLRRIQHADVVDDVLQTLRIRLLVGAAPRIASYRGESSLGVWLRRIAVRIATDHGRSCSRRRAVEVTGLVDDVAHAPRTGGAPQFLHQERWLAHSTLAVEKAVTAAARSLPATERHLLTLHFIEGLCANDLVQLYHVDRSSVYRRIQRCTRRIARMTRALLRSDDCHLDPAALSSAVVALYRCTGISAEALLK